MTIKQLRENIKKRLKDFRNIIFINNIIQWNFWDKITFTGKNKLNIFRHDLGSLKKMENLKTHNEFMKREIEAQNLRSTVKIQ